ncbi:hypothetical protein [uncultured Arcobacter sp.]|mgnify:CR=1 FL=1|uniref:hypothetical protein n=1 Tax=uncultured Arcobacter sp. TaxID=165434 RepID=UPI002626401D|nr:hypothetical protein [uncultured Arcobacter sp.]
MEFKKDKFGYYDLEIYRGYELRYYDSDPYDKVRVWKDDEVVFSYSWLIKDCELEAKKFINKILDKE